MSAIAAIGDAERLRGFALAGVRIAAAGDEAAVRRAWAQLGDDVALVMLTPAAHAALGDGVLDGPEGRLWVVVET